MMDKGERQDDVFALSVPGKSEQDYEGKGDAINVYIDTNFSKYNMKRTEILDFGDEGFLLSNVLSSDECKHYISEGEKIGFGDIQGGNITEYRSSERIMVRSPELAEILYERIKPQLEDITIEGDPHAQHIHGITSMMQGKWTPLRLNVLFRLCRYYPGGHFGPHFDGHFVQSAGERSLKTFMVYLNSNFEGGTTNFVHENQGLHKNESGKYCAEEKNILCCLQPEKGQAIVFNHHRLHEGGQLTDGVKYILRSDIMYRHSEKVTVSPDDERAVQLLQEAERYEASGEGMKAADCYRKAFKLSPSLAEDFGS